MGFSFRGLTRDKGLHKFKLSRNIWVGGGGVNQTVLKEVNQKFFIHNMLPVNC